MLRNGICVFKVMSTRSVYLTTLFLDRFSPLSGKPVLMHIFFFLPETNNCHSAEGRE